VARVATAQPPIEIKNGTILAVDGNRVVIRGPEGVKEYIVSDDVQFNMGGKMLSVHDLKPGMPIAAKITTTQKPLQMTSTEIREAKVLHSIGSAFAVRTSDGQTKKFTAKDIEKRHIVIYKDGKQISPYDLKKGDNITATVVTEEEPQIITSQELELFVAQPPAPRPTRVAQVQRKPAPAPAPAPRELPKTGSRLPWLAVVGMIALAVGAGLTIRRLIVG
jgi:LPXTG-motif cell wall-anchored protein